MVNKNTAIVTKITNMVKLSPLAVTVIYLLAKSEDYQGNVHGMKGLMLCDKNLFDL